MDKQRLHQLTDLVLECQHWGTSHRADITIDNDGDHNVRIYPYVGEPNCESLVYYCDPGRIDTYKGDDFIFDPNFDAAEARIRQLLLEIKVDEDDT